MMSKRRAKIDALTQLRNVGHAFVEVMDDDGRFNRQRVRRREINPFEALYTSGALGSEDRAAIYDLVAIYARSRGLAGRPEEALGVVFRDLPDPHGGKLRMAKYGVAFGEVMARLDPWPGMVLRALISDFVEGDGARGEGDGVRWRGVVRQAALTWNRRWAAAKVNGNDDGVVGGRVDVRESEAGRVAARAIAAASTGGDVRSVGEVLEEVRRWAKTARPEMARYFYG